MCAYCTSYVFDNLSGIAMKEYKDSCIILCHVNARRLWCVCSNGCFVAPNKNIECKINPKDPSSPPWVGQKEFVGLNTDTGLIKSFGKPIQDALVEHEALK